MFDLTTTNTEQTMSSLDFLNNIINPAREAAGQGKIPNRDFVLKVEDELDELPVCEFIAHPYNPNQKIKTYTLTLEQMTLLGMRESKAVRRSVLETLKKLQKPKQELNLNDPKQLLGLLQNYAERTLELEQKVEEAAPKVEFVEKYVDSDGLLGFREVAKMLKVTEVALRDWLISKCIIYRLGSGWAFSSNFLTRKRGEHRTGIYGGKVRTSIKFTPKGFAYIAERISK